MSAYWGFDPGMLIESLISTFDSSEAEARLCSFWQDTFKPALYTRIMTMGFRTHTLAHWA